MQPDAPVGKPSQWADYQQDDDSLPPIPWMVTTTAAASTPRGRAALTLISLSHPQRQPGPEQKKRKPRRLGMVGRTGGVPQKMQEVAA